MAQLNRAALKAFFETGDKPTEAQFADLIDSLFALIDNNTVTKVIIVNIPTVGDGSGGKILKRANAVIAMGEFGGDDTAITSDNGAFVAGGSLFISPNEAALYFNGSTRFRAINTASIMSFGSNSISITATIIDQLISGVGRFAIQDANIVTVGIIFQISSRSFRFGNIPTFANNAAALVGGLLIDEAYKTVTGELRIVV